MIFSVTWRPDVFPSIVIKKSQPTSGSDNSSIENQIKPGSVFIPQLENPLHSQLQTSQSQLGSEAGSDNTVVTTASSESSGSNKLHNWANSFKSDDSHDLSSSIVRQWQQGLVSKDNDHPSTPSNGGKEEEEVDEGSLPVVTAPNRAPIWESLQTVRTRVALGRKE